MANRVIDMYSFPDYLKDRKSGHLGEAGLGRRLHRVYLWEWNPAATQSLQRIAPKLRGRRASIYHAVRFQETSVDMTYLKLCTRS